MIFFDLDGPILDVSERYYKVYSDILSQNGFKTLSKSEYWNAKREKISEHDILKRSLAGPLIEQYLHEWKLIIESDPYLMYDKLQNGAVEVLETLSNNNELVLITLRTQPQQLHKQLENFNLKKYFSAVLSSSEETIPRLEIKYSLIKNFLNIQKIQDCIIIGDTETDITAGKYLGFKTIAVQNGIRSLRILKEANPTLLINSINEILEMDI